MADVAKETMQVHHSCLFRRQSSTALSRSTVSTSLLTKPISVNSGNCIFCQPLRLEREARVLFEGAICGLRCFFFMGQFLAHMSPHTWPFCWNFRAAQNGAKSGNPGGSGHTLCTATAEAAEAAEIREKGGTQPM